MISRTLAILLAILGLYLSAFDAAAQPREGGWRGRGGFGFPGAGRAPFANPGRFGGQGRFALPRADAFRGDGGGYGQGFGPARGGDGGYPAGFAPRAFPAPGSGYGAGPNGFAGGGGRGAFAGGDWRSEQDEVRRAVREGRHIPLGQAIEAVRRRAPGRELDAGLEAGANGRPVYRLRWAGQNGRRQDYMVDAGTGAVLGVQGGP